LKRKPDEFEDFSTLDPATIVDLVDRMLEEDVGRGDITSIAVVPKHAMLEAVLVAREGLVVAGLPIALAVFRRLVPNVRIEVQARDGNMVRARDTIATVTGPARGLLAAERSALNILQHLSGIATMTRRYASAIENTGAKLLDTRKTIPGLRRFAKYATMLGGAVNHRMGLYDAILIKDNHIAIAGGISQAIKAAKKKHEFIEIECDTLEQVDAAVREGVSRILLDNMDPYTLRDAVARAGGIETEASGNVTLERIREIAMTGVTYISVGRVTMSAPAVDIGMDYKGG
jgi:nicotinate-nucleotide pyrophosphorylase (carboxylating)